MTTAPLHTLVISDLHLTTASEPDPERPLWMRYKHRELFVDGSIARMLAHFRGHVRGRIELVLNGDVFDFDAVTQLPDDDALPAGWLERLRGLNPSERKSTWKMERILDDHPVFVEALRALLDEGHAVVFTVGNHDLELLWPPVQAALRRRLDPEGVGHDVRVCEWFYVSGGDTLVEHGHQYDPYCLCPDPLWPTIRIDGEERLRLPFGNYASRLLINGMGLFNPHVESSWNMPFMGYVMFFYRYILRYQPLLLWTWLWSAAVTFYLSLRDGLAAAERDVMRIDERVDDAAARANSTPRTARGLFALRAHPAFFSPWRIARELWLDRVALLVLVLVGSFQVLATAKVVFAISVWWWLVLVLLLFPPFLFYAHGVHTETDGMDRYVRRHADLIAAVAGVGRLVLGHNHHEAHLRHGAVEVLNPGTWSPAFKDLECSEPVGNKCVVWVRPGPGGARVASVEVWCDPGLRRLETSPDAEAVPSLPRPADLLG